MPQSKKTRLGSGSTKTSQITRRRLALNYAVAPADRWQMRQRSERLAPVLALAALAAAVPPLLLHMFAGDMVSIEGIVHFAGVGMTSLALTAAAGTMTIVGARRRDGRTVLIGTAFSVMAALLALHGIATPGVIAEMNGVVAFTGAGTLPIGAAILALSVLPALRRPDSVGPLLALQAFLLVAIFGLGLTALFAPSLVPPVPEPNSPPALAALAAGLAFFLVLALRALRTFLLTRRTEDLVVAVGIFWLGAALPPALTQSYMMVNWWLGHAFELVGIVLVVVPVALDLRRSHQSRPLIGDFRGGRARRGRGSVSRLTGTGADAAPGGEGHVHGGTHASRGTARSAGG